MVHYVGHEGGVVRQLLTHAQGDGLTGEEAVAARRRIHGDGYARRQHGQGEHPQRVHVDRHAHETHSRRDELLKRQICSVHGENARVGLHNPTRLRLRLAASITAQIPSECFPPPSASLLDNSDANCL